MAVKSINRITIIGNVSKEPIVNLTKRRGIMVATLFVLTDREWYSNGEKQMESVSHECVLWGELAQLCKTYVQKGTLVYIEGYMTGSSITYTNRTDLIKAEKIVAEKFIVMEHKKEVDFSELAERVKDNNNYNQREE